MKITLTDSKGPEQTYAYTGGKAFAPALPCITFIHGALHDHSVFTLLARWFAHHGYSVLAVDLPGHGRSTGAPLDTIESLADWVVAVLDATAVHQTALVGHSMGSLIALEVAARSPERVTNLAMLGTAFPMKVSQMLLDTARDQPLAAIDLVNGLSHSSLASKPSYPGPGTWLHGGNRALMRRIQALQTGCNLFHHDFSLCDAYAGGMEAASKVQCPTTLVLGEFDQMTSPRQAGALASALNAAVEMVAAGHALMSEAPDAVLAALRRSMARP